MSVPKICADNVVRVETGALQINDDWPGLFFRGDDAFLFADRLKALLETLPPPVTLSDHLTMSQIREFIRMVEEDMIIKPKENQCSQ